MSTDREALQQIANIANSQLAGTSGSPPPGGGAAVGGDVPAIDVKPSPFADCGVTHGDPKQIMIGPLQVVGVTFTVVEGARSRMMRWFGAPGGKLWSLGSWAIFDSGGGKVMEQVNVAYDGIDWEPYLKQLGPGQYTFAVAQNFPNQFNLGIQWQQG